MYKLLKFLLVSFLSIMSLIVFAQLPTAYDLRNYNLVTPVKDQGLTCGSCWAFASCAAIESQWLKQGYPAFNLSEDNLIDCHLFDEAPCDGGSFYMTQAVLSLHKGILLETDDSYTPDIWTCPFMYSFAPYPIAHVEEIRFIPSEISSIKEAIIEFGAVASAMYFNSENYDSENYKYYDSEIDENDYYYPHCVTIIGWDDNMVFPGASGNGGWIIKDSYGTDWADNGYFYCSYYDDGILSENAVFPVRQDIPVEMNESNVYYKDEFGWIDNFGFFSNEAYALVKYTILPNDGVFLPQTIKRIGTYATDDNTTISIELYIEKNGNNLIGFICEKTIECPFKGFYAIDVNLNSDTIGSEIYIKAKYTSNNNYQLPIPIETYEENHTSNFIASSNSAWLSNDGNVWIQSGDGTSYNLDPCIKMYTENAPKSVMQDIPDTICTHEIIELINVSSFPFDSLCWVIDNDYLSNMPTTNYEFSEAGAHNIYLISYLGNNTDTAKNTIIVDAQEIPEITQVGNSLQSTYAYAYQWLDETNNPIPQQTEQYFNPEYEGIYVVKTFNENQCFSFSEPYNFSFNTVKTLNNNKIDIYPNPTHSNIYVELPISFLKENIFIELTDINGNIITTHRLVNLNNKISLYNFESGVYILKIISSSKNISHHKIIKN